MPAPTTNKSTRSSASSIPLENKNTGSQPVEFFHALTDETVWYIILMAIATTLHAPVPFHGTTTSFSRMTLVGIALLARVNRRSAHMVNQIKTTLCDGRPVLAGNHLRFHPCSFCTGGRNFWQNKFADPRESHITQYFVQGSQLWTEWLPPEEQDNLAVCNRCCMSRKSQVTARSRGVPHMPSCNGVLIRLKFQGLQNESQLKKAFYFLNPDRLGPSHFVQTSQWCELWFLNDDRSWEALSKLIILRSTNKPITNNLLCLFSKESSNGSLVFLVPDIFIAGKAFRTPPRQFGCRMFEIPSAISQPCNDEEPTVIITKMSSSSGDVTDPRCYNDPFRYGRPTAVCSWCWQTDHVDHCMRCVSCEYRVHEWEELGIQSAFGTRLCGRCKAIPAIAAQASAPLSAVCVLCDRVPCGTCANYPSRICESPPLNACYKCYATKVEPLLSGSLLPSDDESGGSMLSGSLSSSDNEDGGRG